MNPVSNPFAPSAGQRPPKFAGRSDCIRESDIALQRALAGKPFRSILFLGLRGTGKTVLLNEVSKIAKNHGFLISRLEAPEGANLADLLFPEMRKIIRHISTIERAKDLALKTLGALRNFASIFKIEVSGVGVEIEPVPGVGDSGDLQRDLPDIFENIGEAAQTAGKGWAIFLDEIQYLSQKDLSAMIVSIHRISQLGYPIVLVGAGLPQIAKLAGEAKSYAERLFRYYDIGALDETSSSEAIVKPLEEENVTITEAALDEIVKGTRGYPFYLQQWAACAWDIAPTQQITIDDVKNASVDAVEILDAGFFRVRLDRLTPSELQYCFAMSDFGEGPYKTGAIARKLHKKTADLGVVRANLISKGMIYATSRGYLDFTVPLFADFLRRHQSL